MALDGNLIVGVEHESLLSADRWGFSMRRSFTLEYWQDGPWFVGRLVEVPGVFSQGETLDELRENIQDAYELMVTRERPAAPPAAQRQEVELEV